MPERFVGAQGHGFLEVGDGADLSKAVILAEARFRSLPYQVQ